MRWLLEPHKRILHKVDFTREPIIETVITPKEGYKLVVRSSKASGQEEFFVDAVEVVSFGSALFFRSVEKPKSFLVPTSDYEVLEVREARMVLKHVGVERSIKIGGGKEQSRPVREPSPERLEPPAGPISVTPTISEAPLATPADAPIAEEQRGEGRFDRKRDRRRHYRRRRGGRDDSKEGWNEQEEGTEGEESSEESEKITLVPPNDAESETTLPHTHAAVSTSLLSSLLPPPPTLISETIAKYRESDKFKDAFYSREQRDREGSEEPALEEAVSNEEEAKSEEEVVSAGSVSFEAEKEFDQIQVVENEQLELVDEPIPHILEKKSSEDSEEPIS